MHTFIKYSLVRALPAPHAVTKLTSPPPPPICHTVFGGGWRPAITIFVFEVLQVICLHVWVKALLKVEEVLKVMPPPPPSLEIA